MKFDSFKNVVGCLISLNFAILLRVIKNKRAQIFDTQLKPTISWGKLKLLKLLRFKLYRCCFSVRERRAPNQMRNMMRIGRRSDPLMARAQQKMFDYNNQNNEVDYSHLFRPNGFF